MTIDEYINEMQRLKIKSERLLKEMREAETPLLSPRDPLNLGDGTPRNRSGGNGTENKLLESIDIHREFSKVNDQFKEMRDAIRRAVDNMIYWQGCLIHHVYVYNVYFYPDDILNGAEEIVHTTNRREILAKLGEAKAALAVQLRAQGVEIEA